jgi:hypothetical protein
MIKTNAKKADAIAQIITNKKTSSYLLISKDGIEIKNPEKE